MVNNIVSEKILFNMNNIIFCLIFSIVPSTTFGGSNEHFLPHNLLNGNLKIPTSKSNFLLLKNMFEVMYFNELRAGIIQAQMNNYTDQILGNVKKLIVEAGLDPMELSQEVLGLPPLGSVTLSNGWLQETSTISRYNDVIISYNSETKIMQLTLPLSFKTLLATYDYHAQALLLGVSGKVNVKITNARMDLTMGFNFKTYHAFVDKADVRDTGSISLQFTGNGLVDWLIDLMSGVITTFFKGIILTIVDLVIAHPIQDAVGQINDVIDSILHPEVPPNMVYTL
ncbi:uncharacterized protein LOC132696509 [Cylas formicarius]|uniref:uncharacterized protein LOC132696509 n=1 Tax=Cylas formicarius TaxID=197179 RepID=UPI0029589E19|nr:uncharacterized protein LOC132696509 [Cylas formicarius]